MNETVNFPKDALREGLNHVLENAKVPMHQHLAALKAVQRTVEEGKVDRKLYLEHLVQSKRERDAHVSVIEHLRSIKNQPGRDGKDGLPGRDGKDGKNGRNGIDGVSPSIETIVSSVLPHIPTQEFINPEKVAQEVAKILKDKQMLDMSHIKGAQKFIKDGTAYRIEELMHGGSAFSGIPVIGETVSGSVTTYTLAYTPIANSLAVYARGQRYFNFTISGAVITTGDTWAAGDIAADYRH